MRLKKEGRILRRHKFYAYQWSPVSVQKPNLQRWYKLGASHHKEVQVEEEFKLLVQNLQNE